MLRATENVRRGGGRRAEAGFSALETLVGTAILLTMLTLAFSLLDQGQTTFMSQSAAELAQARARKALNILAHEVSLAGAQPTTVTSGAQPGLRAFSSSVTASATALRFVADRDGSGTTDGTGAGGDGDISDDVAYWLSNGTLWRAAPNDPSYVVGGAAAPQPVIEGVTGFTITYFDASGAQLAAPVATLSAVRSVAVSLTTSAPALGGQSRSVTMTARVALRNSQLDKY
jgi:type II secretory pathway component PulJ